MPIGSSVNSALASIDVWFHRSQRNVPSIVAVQPTGIFIAAFHPGVGAGNCLNTGSARFSVPLITPERVLNIFASCLRQAARQDCGILDSRRASLRHVRRHGMAGIAQEDYPPIAPAWQRLAFEYRPFVAVRARFEHCTNMGVKTLVSSAPLFHLAFGRPRFTRYPFRWFRNAGHKIKLGTSRVR